MNLGWAVWVLALWLVLGLPGTVWKPLPAPPFPWQALIPSALGVVALCMGAWLWAARVGPAARRSRLLSLLEMPPDLLWGGLVLACWPAIAGPPNLAAWLIAFLATALPGEVRWLAQALPGESPFPAAWGAQAVHQARFKALKNLVPRWLGARLPIWLTGGLVLERMLGVQGLGTDWCQRVASRDRWGMAAWIVGLALLWWMARPQRREVP